jgi:simple sugar transport system ATP-binding protein
MAPILEIRGITKHFPGILANDHIDLTLEQGEILALLGENGAGKTTLMNILYGLYQPDEGEIYVRGQKLVIEGPSDAIRAGIGMVHQHFMLVPVFTVAENVVLGQEKILAAGFLNGQAAAKQVRALSQAHGLEVDPEAYVKDLAVGVQQRVEILKLLYRQADILILDEPTAVLTPQESEELFNVMRALVLKDKSIIFITHKLREVLEVADRITVLRRGAVVGTTTPPKASRAKLAEMMVGREVRLEVAKGKATPGQPVLEVRDLVVINDRRQVAVDGISLEVREGEVLGIAGVQGNGQTELVEVITGLRKPLSGTVRLVGKDVTGAAPRRITELGAAHVPEDRQRDGLVLPYSVADNLALQTYYRPPFARGVVLRQEEILRSAEARIGEFDIRTPGAKTPAGSLSGGNQQKVIVAREFSRPIRLLVASQPTRGLDVGSIEYIHGRILQKRQEGCAVLLVSPELDEVLELSDRIAVMYRGRIVATVAAGRVTKQQVGLLMAGIVPEGLEEQREVRTVEVTL